MIFPFIVKPRSPFLFNPTLDGRLYSGRVAWNVARQDWYLAISQTNGALIFNRPLIESASLLSIDSASYDDNRHEVTIVTTSPHGLPIGSCPLQTVAGMVSDDYNGTFEMVASGPQSLVYPLSDDPGMVSVVGSVGYRSNMAYGYFDSTITYHDGNIEVLP